MCTGYLRPKYVVFKTNYTVWLSVQPLVIDLLLNDPTSFNSLLESCTRSHLICGQLFPIIANIWYLLSYRVTEFEFTPECVVFDLLNIKLMHGWLVDPQNVEAVSAINSLSYNQLVEKIIASKQDGAETELVSEGMLITMSTKVFLKMINLLKKFVEEIITYRN